MQSKIIFGVLVIALAIALNALSFRYRIATGAGQSGYTVIVDNWTGRAWNCEPFDPKAATINRCLEVSFFSK